HIHPILRACSMRSWWLNPRSRDRFARTASALNVTALRSGAREVARVVLPAPGNPMIRILRTIVPPRRHHTGHQPGHPSPPIASTRLPANYTGAVCASEWLNELIAQPLLGAILLRQCCNGINCIRKFTFKAARTATLVF